ncbi:hypothetical protein [Gemmata sp.]|uniref:hypothetical protein n=1 Tax=Gemmata sp. TaxID=1914242 RepID=UPI003F71CA31
MAAQNYAVEVFQFGDWPRGTVLPEFVALWAFGAGTAADAPGRRAQVQELVDRGVLRPTRAEVEPATLARIKDLAGARARAAPGGAPQVPDHLLAEIDDLRSRARAETDRAEAEAERAAALEKKLADAAEELVDYVAKNAHLGRACEEHQTALDAAEKRAAAAEAKVSELTAELEAATAPPAK